MTNKRNRDGHNNGNEGFTGNTLSDAFRFTAQGEDGGPSMYEGISDLLRPGQNIYELVSNTRLTPEHADAITSLMERGMARLSNTDKDKLAKNELDYSQMPLPLRMVAEFCMVRISVGGLGRAQITSAITGVAMRIPDPDDQQAPVAEPVPAPQNSAFSERRESR